MWINGAAWPMSGEGFYYKEDSRQWKNTGTAYKYLKYSAYDVDCTTCDVGHAAGCGWRIRVELEQLINELIHLIL